MLAVIIGKYMLVDVIVCFLIRECSAARALSALQHTLTVKIEEEEAAARGRKLTRGASGFLEVATHVEGTFKDATKKLIHLSRLTGDAILGGGIQDVVGSKEKEEVVVGDEEEREKTEELEEERLEAKEQKMRKRGVLGRFIADPRFDHVMLVVIIFSTICVAIDNPLLDPDSKMVKDLAILDFIVVVIFTIEAVLKIGGLGWKKYFADSWNNLVSLA
ncbi:ion transporter [bacterium]|nr:ion transporter [bacterium]